MVLSHAEVGVTCFKGGDRSLDSCCTSGDGVPMGEESTDLLVWSCENAIPLGPCGSTSLLMSREPPADTMLDAKGLYFLSLSSPAFPALMAKHPVISSSTLCLCMCACVCLCVHVCVCVSFMCFCGKAASCLPHKL